MRDGHDVGVGVVGVGGDGGVLIDTIIINNRFLKTNTTILIGLCEDTIFSIS